LNKEKLVLLFQLLNQSKTYAEMPHTQTQRTHTSSTRDNPTFSKAKKKKQTMSLP